MVKDEDSEFATGFLGTLLKEILVSCFHRFRTWSRNQKPMVALEAQPGEGLKYFLSAFWMLDIWYLIGTCSEIWSEFCLKVSELPALVGDVLCLVCLGCLGTFLEDKKLIFCLIGCLFLSQKLHWVYLKVQDVSTQRWLQVPKHNGEWWSYYCRLFWSSETLSKLDGYADGICMAGKKKKVQTWYLNH